MSNCPQCHAPLPEESPFGVCPACLLDGGTRKRTLDDEVDLGFLGQSPRPDTLGLFDGYAILDLLGQGASGIVLKAEDPILRRMVAIKILHPVLATSAVSRERFTREARAAAAVSHHHVVTVHAVAEWNGLPYLVMECISGRSLAERIRADGPLELKQILRIGQQMSASLAAAHEQGLVHRDVKPANVLLENSVERVKLTDFGLARMAHEERLTLTGYVAGTLDYMAPEQAGGGSVDHRCDLYALGAVVHAMATGHPPVRESDADTSAGKAEPEGQSAALEDRPSWLVEMVNRLLEADPAKRPQTAEEVERWFAQKLTRLQEGSSHDSSDHHREGTGPVPLTENKKIPWAIIAGLVIVAVIAALIGSRDNDRGTPPVAKPAAPAELQAERELLETFVELSLETNKLVPTASAPPIEAVLSSEAGYRVHFLGNQPSGGPSNPGSSFDFLELIALGEQCQVPDAEKATYILMLLGEDGGRGNPDRLIKRIRKLVEENARAPAGGAWVGAIFSNDLRNRITPGRGEPGIHVWAIQPPS